VPETSVSSSVLVSSGVLVSVLFVPNCLWVS
jgi:hypothetical protein